MPRSSTFAARWSRRAAALLALAPLALAPLAAAAQPVPEPLPIYVLPGGAADDGCRRQWQTNAAVQARSAPTELSRPTRTIDGLRRVDANDYSEALTVVLQTGRVRALQALTISGATRLLDGEVQAVRLAAGDELVVLGRGGEGTSFFVYLDAVWTGDVPGFSVRSDAAELTQRPVTETWVRLIEHGPERPAAWLNTAQAGIQERERSCGG